MKKAFCFPFFLIFIFAFAVFFVCCGGGAGGAAAAGKAKGSGNEKKENKVVTTNEVSNTKLGDITYTGGAPVVISSNEAANVTPFEISVTRPGGNKKSTGSGIYSEWLRGKIASIELIVSVDGVQQTYTLAENETLQLNDIHVGSKIEILAGSKINLKSGDSKNIVPKTYTVEGNSNQKLPVFVEYTATFESPSFSTTATYKSDSAIQLPILDNATFVGWKVEASGLSIDGNYYAKGGIVPAGEICGDVKFVADLMEESPMYTFDNMAEFTIDYVNGIKSVNGATVSIYFGSSSSGTRPTACRSLTVANTSLATTTIDDVTASNINNGTTTLNIGGTSRAGYPFVMKVPYTVELPNADNYNDNTEFGIYTQAQFNAICDLLSDGKNFNGKTITLNSNVSVPSNYTPKTFYGTLDGNNKTLTGTLFSSLWTNAKVQNLNVIVPSETLTFNSGNREYMGGIANYSYGTIENCKVSGSKRISVGYSTELRAGGLVGTNDNGGIIKNCINELSIIVEATNINAVIKAGGITGVNSGTIQDCTNKGNITIIPKTDTQSYLGYFLGESATTASASGNTNLGGKVLFNTTEVTTGLDDGSQHTGAN